MVATGRGAGMGVLFRNAEAIETLRKVDTLVLDKTGTLTAGRPELVAVRPDDPAATEALRLAASLERASEHPIGAAIVAGAEARGLALEAPRDFTAVSGMGATGVVDDHELTVGNLAMLEERGIDPGDLRSIAEEEHGRSRTTVFVAVDGRARAVLAVADPIKPTTPAALRALQNEGIELVMLTGDAPKTAATVASELGIDRFEAEVLPDAKAAAVARLQSEGHVVAMAGDGINDAPALARADVGIAMGTGTDVAIESASVTLVKGDLDGLVRARRLSRATIRNIRQNLAFAFGYNSLGIPIAAGLLYPAFGLLLSPMIAAAAMSLSSVSVIANALRLRTARL